MASGQGRSPAALLEAVGLPTRGSHTPKELSGGEQQRVAIARSLVNSPPLILADEPTGNLDSKMSSEIMDIFLSLNKAGITIVMVTHEDDIAAYAKRLIRFKDGAIVSDQPVANPTAMKGPGLDVQKLRQARVGSPSASRVGARLGELLDSVRSAARSLLQNKLRAALTILGILIGVGAVIAMVSVGQGATAGVTSKIAGLGSNYLTITPGSTTVGGVRAGFGSMSTLTVDDATAIKSSVSGIAGVEPESSSNEQLKYKKSNWNTSVIGTTADYTVVKSWDVEEGSFFTEEDYKAGHTVAVLGKDVVTNLFGDEDPIGKTITIQNVSFKVIGVLTQKGSGGSFQSQDDKVLIPFTTMYARFRHEKDVRSIGVTVTEASQLDAVKADITALLRARHKIADGADADFSIVSQQDVMQTVQETSSIMTMLLGAIGGISLLVGGIGIMNIMLVSVTERTREIGIRKALGARRRHIMSQFLIEAVILSGLGGLLGWGLGAVASKLISVLGSMTVSLTMGTVAIALGFSLVVGLFFGIYPARKASRMDPIQALRFE